MHAPSISEIERAKAEIYRQRLLELEEEAVSELAAIQDEMQRRAWAADPVLWTEERIGEKIWSGQKRILRSVLQHRKTAVPTCHDIGKSFTAGLITGWWLDIHPPGEAFVITSAPTAAQVRAVLWREIGRVHAKGQLQGRVNQTEWHMVMPAGNEEIVAFGRKPADYDPTSFQGFHARRVLYIFDEACGMLPPLWEAADSLIANDASKALAIGNPDIPGSTFAENCMPGSGWNVVQISAFDSPNFTGELLPAEIKEQLIGYSYVEEKRKKWASKWTWNGDRTRCVAPEGSRIEDTNPYWQSKVLGIFPSNPEIESLIPLSWIRAAQDRTLEPVGDSVLGGDVGGGGDSSTCCQKRGSVCRVLWEDHNPDTMETCGRFVQSMRETQAVQVKVDVIGIGRGIVDRGKELELPFIGINVGEAATDPESFVNLRSELWWNVRTRFETGNIDIDETDEDLAAELATIRFKRMSNGKIKVESKEEARNRGVSSPNRADSLMLALGQPLAGLGPMQVVPLTGFGS